MVRVCNWLGVYSLRNWPFWTGIHGHFGPEIAAIFRRKPWPFSSGIHRSLTIMDFAVTLVWLRSALPESFPGERFILRSSRLLRWLGHRHLRGAVLTAGNGSAQNPNSGSTILVVGGYRSILCLRVTPVFAPVSAAGTSFMPMKSGEYGRFANLVPVSLIRPLSHGLASPIRFLTLKVERHRRRRHPQNKSFPASINSVAEPVRISISKMVSVPVLTAVKRGFIYCTDQLSGENLWKKRCRCNFEVMTQFDALLFSYFSFARHNLTHHTGRRNSQDGLNVYLLEPMLFHE